jgi:hypothetical protein
MRSSRLIVALTFIVIAVVVPPLLAADAKQLEQDVDKIKTWATTYGDSRLIEEDPARLAEVIAQAPKVKEEVKAIVARYDEKSAEGRKLSFPLGAFERNFGMYESRIEAFKRDAPGQVAKHLDEAEKMSDEAVAQKKPLYFTGGVPQRMRWAAEKLPVIAVVDPEAAKPLQARYDSIKASLPQKEAALRNEIIAANEPPKDNYSGPDKAQLVELAKSAWTEKHPDAQVVAVRIPGQQWKRDTRWTLRSGTLDWEKTDRSKLQAQLLVRSASDPKLLEVHVVDLIKDHLSNDAIKAVRWEAKDLPVQNLILAEKVK